MRFQRASSFLGLFVLLVTVAMAVSPARCAERLRVGLAQRDITPTVDGPKAVWIAGYGQNRRATGIHDPLYCRAIVVSDGRKTIALASLDLVGLQYPEVERIRRGLPQIDYALVSSTHSHEGPDVIGIWGPSPVSSGVDPDYLDFVVRQTIDCVKQAADSLQAATAAYGTTRVEGLLRDSRLPTVYDDILRVVVFGKASDNAQGKQPENLGLLVQWNCHPETLGSNNTLLTADFPYETIAALEKEHGCPAVFFIGAIGGLMTNPSQIKTPEGDPLHDQTFPFAEAYGQQVARHASRAIAAATPIRLTPFTVCAKPIAIPLANRLYIAGRALGVLPREAVFWTGDPDDLSHAVDKNTPFDKLAVRTEVAYLRLGDLHVAGIPGEIYPELVYGRYPEPAEPGADFPEAPLEPCVADLLPGQRWLLLGLANDEIGYIIPKRQWDEKRPFAYGREKSQYGESNSCGSDVAPIVMEALARRVREAGGD